MASESSRPLLLPQNRRVRHLQGLYIRNITIPRPRGRTIDDAEINKTSEKLKALQESVPEHSRSVADLRHAKTDLVRPSNMRRRSTAWAHASPGERQKKLEDVIAARLVDSFFTIHCHGHDDPIYISEVVEKAMNSSFRFFDLSSAPPALTRSTIISVKVWVRQQDYTLFLDQRVNLRKLYFTKLNQPLPDNCIIFHFTDGLFTTDQRLAIDIPPPRPAPSLPTSSYRALMRLSMLDNAIQDALNTREQLASQINDIIRDNPREDVDQVKEDARLAARYVAVEQKSLKQSERRRAELLQSLKARREAMEKGREAQDRAQEDVNSALEKLEQCRAVVKTTAESMHGQRRRICEELLHIFPVEPTQTSLLFTICGLPLPNSSFDEADEDTVSAALGLVARLVDMLQYYLSVPIPYPVTSFGSRSVIQDQISMLPDSQRIFPLYTKGTIRFRFDYAVFLLNKDIESLAESQGLRVMDIRHTLPNIKYLLYVCSAGTSELPARKAGGVRGLMSGRGTPFSSRKNSDASAQGDARKALENGSNAVMIKSKSLFNGRNRSLRSSGLRENVAS